MLIFIALHLSEISVAAHTTVVFPFKHPDAPKIYPPFLTPGYFPFGHLPGVIEI